METEPQNGINNLDNSQEDTATRGRGRPKGSSNKPRIGDYITPAEVEELMTIAKKEAKAGKTDMLKFILDQLFGKARQNIGLEGGEEGEKLIVQLINYGDSKDSPQS